MELVLHAVAARVAFGTHCLNPEHVSSVWGKVINLDRIFLQNQDCVGGHIALVIILRIGKMAD